MTDEQENHLKSIKDNFSSLADKKYRAGQKEHGGNLFDMSPEQLLDNALDEAIDQVVYLLTLKEKLFPKPNYVTTERISVSGKRFR